MESVESNIIEDDRIIAWHHMGYSIIVTRYDDNDMSLLLTGKASLEYVNQIEYLIESGYAVPPEHLTDSFSENNNTNVVIDTILENLK